MTQVGYIGEIGREKWDVFVESHPQGSLYHSSSWHEVIERTYGYKAIYHTVLADGGEIKSGLSCAPVRNLLLGRRLVSFPYSDYCDPLICDEEDASYLTTSLLKQADQLHIKNVEIRCNERAKVCVDLKSKSGYYNFVLPLRKSSNALFNGFHKSCVQRAIRKAERSGLELREGRNRADLLEFYELHMKTRKKLGVPFQPLRFFETLWQIFSLDKRASLLLTQKDGMTIAAILLLKFKATTYYKFAASDRRFLHLRPNHLLIWEALRRAQSQECQAFDFGRASLEEGGLIDFKRRWGAHAYRLTYKSIGYSAENFSALQRSSLSMISKRIFSRLPTRVGRCFAGFIYRHAG